MIKYQKTIKKKITLDGIGLHHGVHTTITFIPTKIDSGISFLRTDIKKSIPIAAKWTNIAQSNLCSKLSNLKNETVSTVEHLMFALYSLEISNLIIEIDGPEVPIFDGSAKIFINSILKCGIEVQRKAINTIKFLKEFEVIDQNKFIKYQPTNKNYLEIRYSIDYKDQFIKKQSFLLKDCHKNYSTISECRTFCHQEDLQRIFAMGLAKGGSLDNAIVVSGNKVLNQGGLRCKNEFVKHKMLDCVGDLYLSGYFLNGKIVCNQGGHELTANLLKKMFENKENYLVDNSKSIIENELEQNKFFDFAANI